MTYNERAAKPVRQELDLSRTIECINRIDTLVQKLPASFELGHFWGGEFCQSFKMTETDREIIRRALYHYRDYNMALKEDQS